VNGNDLFCIFSGTVDETSIATMMHNRRKTQKFENPIFSTTTARAPPPPPPLPNAESTSMTTSMKSGDRDSDDEDQDLALEAIYKT
jgi:hypothetical protein